jgi:hypothetical protein
MEDPNLPVDCKLTGEDYLNKEVAFTIPILVVMALPIFFVLKKSPHLLTRNIILKQVLPIFLVICYEVMTGLASFPAKNRCKDEGVNDNFANAVATSGGYSLCIQVVDFIQWTSASWYVAPVPTEETVTRSTEEGTQRKLPAFKKMLCFVLLWLVLVWNRGDVFTARRTG